MMKTVMESMIAALYVLVLVQISYGQQAEAPMYKDGDWWRLKAEAVAKPGFSRSGRCDESHPEYLVKIEQRKPKVFAVSGNKEEEIDCPTIADQLLDVGRNTGRYLKFPLALNNSWTFQVTGEGPKGRAQSERIKCWPGRKSRARKENSTHLKWRLGIEARAEMF